jgi:hypothetical protein
MILMMLKREILGIWRRFGMRYTLQMQASGRSLRVVSL